VILLLPFQGHFYTSWHAVAAILLGGLLWAIIVEYLARYVARTTAVAAA
jgi:VanZ family protein